MKVFNKRIWKKHANPWSGWTRVIAFLLFPVPIWYHSWIGLGIVLFFFAINPFLFAEPKSTDNWMSKSILGEEMWTKNGLFQRDFPTVLNILNGLSFFLMVYSAFNQLIFVTIFSTILSSVFKLWFLDRMTLKVDQ